MMTPEQAKLLQILSTIDQIGAAAGELVAHVDDSELDCAMELRDLVAWMTIRVERGIEELQGPNIAAANFR
jgi:hypothetical protein